VTEAGTTSSRYVLMRYCWSFISGDCIVLDLGMESGSITDDKITASSAISQAKNGRLNNSRSWCADTANDNIRYLQIDLQTLHIICAVSTQGNPLANEWVETYTLQVSIDGAAWTDYEEFGQVKVSLSAAYSFRISITNFFYFYYDIYIVSSL